MDNVSKEEYVDLAKDIARMDHNHNWIAVEWEYIAITGLGFSRKSVTRLYCTGCKEIQKILLTETK